MLTLDVIGSYVFGEYRSRLVGNRGFSLDVHRFSLKFDRKFEELFESQKDGKSKFKELC